MSACQYSTEDFWAEQMNWKTGSFALLEYFKAPYAGGDHFVIGIPASRWSARRLIATRRKNRPKIVGSC
jgi:hypothetical protein